MNFFITSGPEYTPEIRISDPSVCTFALKNQFFTKG